jgi:hypothetical protein
MGDVIGSHKAYNPWCQQPDTAMEAYIANAQFHLDLLRSTVHDALTGHNDAFLKTSLLQDIDAIDTNLRKAQA